VGRRSPLLSFVRSMYWRSRSTTVLTREPFRADRIAMRFSSRTIVRRSSRGGRSVGGLLDSAVRHFDRPEGPGTWTRVARLLTDRPMSDIIPHSTMNRKIDGAEFVSGPPAVCPGPGRVRAKSDEHIG